MKRINEHKCIELIGRSPRPRRRNILTNVEGEGTAKELMLGCLDSFTESKNFFNLSWWHK